MSTIKTLRHALMCAGTASVIVATPLASNAALAGMNAPSIEPSASSSLIQISTDEKALNKAQGFVNNVAEKGIAFLSDEALTIEQRKKAFRELLKRNFDMKTIARFALGRHWRTATDKQRKEYTKLFEKMVLNVYAQRFSDYQGQKLIVSGARPEGKKDILVQSKITPANGGQTIRVDWRIRNKSGKNKIIDIMVEGVSMSLTQRSDFSSVIQRGGGDIEVLLEHLREQ